MTMSVITSYSIHYTKLYDINPEARLMTAALAMISERIRKPNTLAKKAAASRAITSRPAFRVIHYKRIVTRVRGRDNVGIPGQQQLGFGAGQVGHDALSFWLG